MSISAPRSDRRKEPSLFTEARAVVEQRRRVYGDPGEDFARTARIWSAVLGIDVTPRQVALCMIGVKLSRECHRHTRDNLVDIAGYAEALNSIA